MNFRNRKLVITVRVLLGLIFLASGIAGLLMGDSMEGVPERMIPVMEGLYMSGIFHMIKITEVVAGLMLVIGFLPALATIFLAPIAVGIVVVDALLSPEYLFVAFIVGILTAYLGYAYFDKYRPMFTR